MIFQWSRRRWWQNRVDLCIPIWPRWIAQLLCSHQMLYRNGDFVICEMCDKRILPDQTNGREIREIDLQHQSGPLDSDLTEQQSTDGHTFTFPDIPITTTGTTGTTYVVDISNAACQSMMVTFDITYPQEVLPEKEMIEPIREISLHD